MITRHLLLLLLLGHGSFLWAQGTPADYERAARLRGLTQGKVFKASVQPHWYAKGDRFWYRNELPDGAREFIGVDAVKGQRGPAFDHEKLATVLGEAAKEEYKPDRLPIEHLEFEEAGEWVRLNVKQKGWRYNLQSHAIESCEAPKAPPARQPQGRGFGRGGQGGGPQRASVRATSPGGKWTAFIKENNVWLRVRDGQEIALSKDGAEDAPYEDRFYWSPDGTKLVALRTKKAQEHKVHFVESSPRDQVQPKLHSFDYLKPGDEIAQPKPRLFDVTEFKPIHVSDELFAKPWSIDGIRWEADSSRFTFGYNERGHQVLRIVAVDARSGAARAIVDEQSKTFLDYAHKRYAHFVEGKDEIIWMSERDGWNHLYLFDAQTGEVKNQITKGEWVVRGVDRVDDRSRQIWFRASGVVPEQDPYYVHHGRINYDGTGLVWLTVGDGTHAIEYSPDRRFYLDTYSRVDLPPVTELRRTEDGQLVCALERGDWSALLATGWKVPERFVAKGRDGTTDIHGLIYRPTNFDPAKKYPVIEDIYAGPQGSFVPKQFALFHSQQALAELGFIVVKIDGMGTSNRSKAFHDVCCKNLADAGFPDRILWMKAAAAKYPQLDLTRVGIFGTSAGGQNALGGLLLHSDFYKVGVAACGCHDNRMDKIWWNELWMGYPIGPHYAEQSNVTLAHRLRGKLLLIVGEMDRNVDPASTMQVVNALIRANKDFDLLVIPGAGHSNGGAYGMRRQQDFFVRHLLKVEPPDRNGSTSTNASSGGE